METLSFAFGMLTVLAIILIAVVAVGMVKVLKMQSNIDNLYRVIEQTDSHILNRISNDYQSLDRVICDNQKEMLSLHKESIDETIRVFEQVDKRLDDLNRYVDSRFDKMENKFISNSAKKQIIND